MFISKVDFHALGDEALSFCYRLKTDSGLKLWLGRICEERLQRVPEAYFLPDLVPFPRYFSTPASVLGASHFQH